MLATPLFLLGYLFLWVPMFFGKAIAFRATHGCGFWRAFRQYTVVLAVTWPMMSLWFFLNYAKQLDFTMR